MKVYTGKNKGRYVLRTVKSGPNKGKKYRVYLKPGQKAPATTTRKRAPTKAKKITAKAKTQGEKGKRDMGKLIDAALAAHQKQYGTDDDLPGQGEIHFKLGNTQRKMFIDYLKRLERYGLANAKKEAIRRVSAEPDDDRFHVDNVKYVKKDMKKLGAGDRAWKYMVQQLIFWAFHYDVDMRREVWEKATAAGKDVTLTLSTKGAKHALSYGDNNPAVYFHEFI